MPTQNLNTYYYPKYKSFLNSRQYFDLTLAADERDYDEEVVFSTDVIALNDGTRLPIHLDLNDMDSCPQLPMFFDTFYTGGTLVSKNYYNPDNLDLTCLSAFTGTCDVGLTATDNGLYTGMTGQTLYYTMGLRNDYKFHPHYYDRRMKFHMVTGYTLTPNQVFSGRPKNVMYNMVSKTDQTIGYYQELYGGFYQGFYKLFGYDYEVFPERLNKGWTMETVIRPRITDEYTISATTEEYLNTRYPDNAGTFFYFGTRAENKYYHFADGHPESDSGYTRVTSGLTSLETCKCSDTGITNSNCVKVYPLSATTAIHNIGCGCGACTEQIPVPPLDPKFDVLSNALSIRFSGCAADPRICVKVMTLTGDCVTTGTCSTTGVTFQTGYTITEVCSPPIYGICDYICTAITEDRWVMVSAVFERYTTIEECDLLNLGGLNDIREVTYQSILNDTSYNLIMPPETHSGGTKEDKVYRIVFDRKWFDDTYYRMGRLKIYINGYYFMVIENFEEVIPRELNCEKEKQIGVPFNISWGGGTQGLHDHLIFSSDTATTGPYIQDPELFPNEILSATTFNELSTQILMEQNFGGTFMGALSQFRMYTEPFNSSQVQHNFRILRDKFNLFDFWCPNCLTPSTPTPTPTATPTPTPTATPTPTPTATPTPTPTATPTPTPTATPTPTPTATPTPTPTATPTPTPTPTPSPTPIPSSIFNIVLFESGPDVVLSGSGTLNLTDLTPRIATDTTVRYITPLFSRFSSGPINNWTGRFYTGTTISVPSNIGTGFQFNATTGSFSGSGLGVIYNPYSTTNSLFVDSTYVSGDFMTTYTVWYNRSFSSMGLTPGTYTYSWGTGANYGIINLQI